MEMKVREREFYRKGNFFFFLHSMGITFTRPSGSRSPLFFFMERRTKKIMREEEPSKGQ